MLLYQPPFLMVDGVTVFPDHADPEAFYYVVSLLSLVRNEEGPAFWATAILPAASVDPQPPAGTVDLARATLSFDVECALPTDPTFSENLRKEIQKHWGREAKRLVAAPLLSGKAHLTVARPGGEEVSKDFFAYQGHPPSLMDTNRAAFAVAAQGQEAQALVASLTAGHVAAVVSYEVEFLGLAPAFEARMVVHWSQVYHHFRERELTNFLFYSDEVDRVSEQLGENRAIEIEVSELDPEGAKAATKALFDELKSQIIKKLFETPRPAGDVPIEDRIGRGVRDVLTAILPGAGHTLRSLDQHALSDAVIDLREQQVHAYPFYPQSTLAGLIRGAGGVEGRLLFVRLDDLPNRLEQIVVELAPDASRLGVQSVELQIDARTPGREEPLLERSVILRGATIREVLPFRRFGTEEPVVRYRANMSIDSSMAPGGREHWSFDWRTVEGQRVWFNPEEWLDVVEMRVEVDDPAVFEGPTRVEMAIEAWVPGDATPLRRGTFHFTKEVPAGVFTVIVPEGQTPTFQGRETFRRLGELDFVRDIPVISGSAHRIMNPFGKAWSMEVRAVANWATTEALLAELRVWDVARKIWLRDDHRFMQDSTAYTLRFLTSPETPRKAEARVTRIGTDASIVRGPWKDLAGAVVAVTDAVEPLRRLRVTLIAPHFTAVGVRRARADIEYHDPDQRIHETAELTFSGDGTVVDWLHPFRDPSRPLYRYRLRASGQNGETYKSAWAEGGDDDLQLILPASPWLQ